MAEDIEVVLLDLGGVLLRLRDPFETFGIDMSDDQFVERWLLSPAVRKLERGTLAIPTFAAEMVQEFELSFSPEEFVRRFKRWPDALYDGVPELLSTIANDRHLGLLSNTNAIHWERDDIAGQLEPIVHSIFLSYRNGLVKPDQAAFDNVLTTLGTAAGRVLFMDDNPLNINAARNCGMRAELTRGFDDLTENLVLAGITT